VSETTVSFDILNSTVSDATAPTVAASVGGTYPDLRYQATATDDTGVALVEFYVDNIYVGHSAQAPYEVLANVGALNGGIHQLVAVAYDAYGNSRSAATAFSVLAVIPAHRAVLAGESVSFAADGSLSGEQVTWSVEGAACGSISTVGLYTAPAAPARCEVVATSSTDLSKRAVTRVGVYTGDLNGDGHVDGDDLGHMAEAFGSSDAAADFDYSSSVDDTDITLLTAQFGR
jgi:hypothetical protein